jgi:ABC-type transporter Mla maintaining outer membrane lipid asymmetry permease subunit MlaE
MARRKENIIEQLYEVTGWFWPVGLVITLIIAVLTALSINWCLSYNPSGFVGEAIAPLLLARWLIPVVLSVFTLFFANKTYITWMNS